MASPWTHVLEPPDERHKQATRQLEGCQIRWARPPRPPRANHGVCVVCSGAKRPSQYLLRLRPRAVPAVRSVVGDLTRCGPTLAGRAHVAGRSPQDAGDTWRRRPVLPLYGPCLSPVRHTFASRAAKYESRRLLTVTSLYEDQSNVREAFAKHL